MIRSARSRRRYDSQVEAARLAAGSSLQALADLAAAEHSSTPSAPPAPSRAPAHAVAAVIDLAEAREPFRRGHSLRVAHLAASLAAAMGHPDEMVERVRLAGRLHDVGMLSICDSVVQKVGPLTAAERTQIQDHVQIGIDFLNPLTDDLELLRFIEDHHERLDGSGYPWGLSGDTISVGGRLLAVADAFDALASARPNRPQLSWEGSLAVLQRDAGSRYDADVLEALRTLVERSALVPFVELVT